MELKEYQSRAMGTCMPTSDNFTYMFTNLVGETGEFASKVAKAIRKGKMRVENNQLCFCDAGYNETKDLINELKLEAGDILWQLSGLVSTLGMSLEEIAQMNLDKLASRKERNVIDGSGDHR